MKNCTKCNQEIKNNDKFCPNCGEPITYENTEYTNADNQEQNMSYSLGTSLDPYDHTFEFSKKDISENKVMAMALYLMGIMGVFIALLAAPQSAYVSFHLKQVMKFFVVSILMTICTVLLCWTVIVPVAYLVMTVALAVIKIICFVQVCNGQAKEPAIIRNLSFLK